ncbi:thioredoxin family protein [bacterium]|nr:thioredoxin family protein [bacterium]
MTYTAHYPPAEPPRSQVDNWQGLVVLEFGTPWCPLCRAAQPALRAALQDCPGIRHVKVEDGKGKPLGRSFGVKLWPTLVLLRDGKNVRQLARPSAREIEQAVQELADQVEQPET